MKGDLLMGDYGRNQGSGSQPGYGYGPGYGRRPRYGYGPGYGRKKPGYSRNPK